MGYLLLALSLFFISPGVAQESVAANPGEPLVLVGDSMRDPALDMSETLLNDLRRGRWQASLTALNALSQDEMSEGQLGDLAFLRGWAAIHTEKGASIAEQLDQMDHAATAPDAYVSLVQGEVYRDVGDAVHALEALERVPDTSAVYARAAIGRAEVLRELSRTKEAFEVYETLVERPDPVSGNAISLLALAMRHGAGSEEAYPYLRRIWTFYPHTTEAVEASRMLAKYTGAAHKSTWQEVGLRAERLMYKGAYAGAVTETERRLSEATDDSEDACRYLYVRGRSAYKRNQLTNAVAGFADAGKRCEEAEGSYGPRSLYLGGTAEFRRGNHKASADLYRQLADLYPDHSMADDGLTRGGISLQEHGDLAGAQAYWQEALDRFPQGDMAPEASWRLAFSHYLEGNTGRAMVAADALAALPLHWDATHVAAGKYWSARWKAYPDVDNPTMLNTDLMAVEKAIEGWAALIEELPWSYYSILAHNRLRELEPERAAQLSIRPEGHQTGEERIPWRVRLSFIEAAQVQDALALMRLGLVGEAKAEWATYVPERSPEEMSLWIEARISAGDWLFAHDKMRSYLISHPLGTLGSREPQIIRLAWPDRYWDLVEASAKDDRYDPRLFHALVREESNFNKTIVSFAGARGLSQLMPATAQQTAGWLGMKVSNSELDDPATNLKIGARYLDAMHKQLSDSPFLSLAAYNAGAGRVGQWLKAWGNVPTDEFVERIPYRETRGYVKRVTSTWQTMRWQFDVENEAYEDLSNLNHQARPE
ncbi:MAG: transglycosylase SLT domain-containing protein [Rhodobacterales bacterium]|nr:transglycosylase SLT domain-containing protein [Rhodobacterales bacterium]